MSRPVLYLLSGVLLLTGCSTRTSHITLKSSLQADEFALDFSHAYALRESAGDYHIVLITEPTPPPPRQPDEPLQPIGSSEPRQLMHIHVFWRPLPGLKGNHPSATNSTIDLYVIGDQDPDSRDIAHYQGTGFVTLYPSSDQLQASITNASIKPKLLGGDMADPLGDCTIEGTVSAQPSAGRVRELLDRVNELTAPARTARASALSR